MTNPRNVLLWTGIVLVAIFFVYTRNKPRAENVEQEAYFSLILGIAFIASSVILFMLA